MRLVVNDTSCFIDLRKAGFLQALFLLPYAFQIALPLVRNEMLDFTSAEIEDLIGRGLEIVDLPPNLVKQAFDYRASHQMLSLYDCMSMALAKHAADSILLTGDQSLRNRAKSIGIEVHGVLWVSDQLENSGHITFAALHDGLVKLGRDPLVFVPKNEIQTRIEKLKKRLGI